MSYGEFGADRVKDLGCFHWAGITPSYRYSDENVFPDQLFFDFHKII